VIEMRFSLYKPETRKALLEFIEKTIREEGPISNKDLRLRISRWKAPTGRIISVSRYRLGTFVSWLDSASAVKINENGKEVTYYVYNHNEVEKN